MARRGGGKGVKAQDLARGAPYGQNQVNEESIVALRATEQTPPAPMGAGGAPPAPFQRPTDDVFGPTERPHEPPTAGSPFGPGPTPPPPVDTPGDVDETLRVLATLTGGHPDILRMLTRRDMRG